jgi:hypothetical protein
MEGGSSERTLTAVTVCTSVVVRWIVVVTMLVEVPVPTVYVRVRSPVALEPALSPAPALGTPVLIGGGRE